MDPRAEFESICGDFETFRAILKQAAELSEDEAGRSRFEQLGQLLDESFQDVRQTLPAALDELEREAAEAERSLAESRQDLDKIRQQLQELRAAGGYPPPPAEEPVRFEPGHGDRLRDELVGRYGTLRPPQSRPAAGDVQEMTSASWDPGSAAVPRPPVQPKPPAPKPPPRGRTKGEDVTDLSSGEWSAGE